MDPVELVFGQRVRLLVEKSKKVGSLPTLCHLGKVGVGFSLLRHRLSIRQSVASLDGSIVASILISPKKADDLLLFLLRTFLSVPLFVPLSEFRIFFSFLLLVQFLF